MNYLDRVKSTYIENWPQALYNLSFAQVDIPLTLEEARAIGFHIIEFGNGFVPLTQEQKNQNETAYAWVRASMWATKTGEDPGPRVDPVTPEPNDEWVARQQKLFEGVKLRASDALTKFPNGAIVRLGSRSPKDSWEWYTKGPRLVAGDDPFKHIISASERMYEDLSLALQNDYESHLFVRQWMPIEPWAEFRCFLDKGVLVGVSQYNYHDYYKEIEDNEDTIRFWLRHYVNDLFKPAFGDGSIVFDLAMFLTRRPSETHATQTTIEFKLVEINPHFEMTDPCLFSWGREFDKSFRFLDKNKKTISISLV